MCVCVQALDTANEHQDEKRVCVSRPLTLPVLGPLVMLPGAEDNYGVDACSVLCLHQAPPVLAIATRDGRIHHCLVLPSTHHAKEKVSFASINLRCIMIQECDCLCV